MTVQDERAAWGRNWRVLVAALAAMERAPGGVMNSIEIAAVVRYTRHTVQHALREGELAGVVQRLGRQRRVGREGMAPTLWRAVKADAPAPAGDRVDVSQLRALVPGFPYHLTTPARCTNPEHTDCRP